MKYESGPVWRDDIERWYVEVRYPDGSRKQRRHRVRRVLERWWAKQIAAIEEGTWNEAQPKSITVGTAFDQYRAHARVHLRSYRRYVKPVLDFWEGHFGREELLAKITTKRLEEAKLEMVDRQKPATINKNFGVLKAFFNWCIDQSLFASNPVRRVKTLPEHNEIVRYLDPDEEYPELLKAARKVPRAWYLEDLIILAVNTGLRRGALLGLRWDEVDFEASAIRKQRTKNNRPHAVPMNESAQEALERLRDVEGDFEYVFAHRAGRLKGQPIGEIKKAWYKAIEGAGIIEFRFHDLRHTFASWLAMSGVDLFTIKELLGHRSIESTMRYAHLSRRHRGRAVSVLDGITFTDSSPFAAANGGESAQENAKSDKSARENPVISSELTTAGAI